MPPIENVLAFAAAAAVLIAVPGPSVLFVVGRSLALGRRGGVLTVAGNSLGVLCHVVLVAVGVGTIIAQSVVLFTVIKYLGAVYLVYLGVQAIRHRQDTGARTSAGADQLRSDASESRAAHLPPVARIIREGCLVGVTNPKAIVFIVAVLPQFVDYGAGAVPLQLLVLGGVFVLISFTLDCAWAVAAGAARGWFASRPRRISQVSAAGGVLMIGLGAWVALSSEPPRARALVV
ncbi:TPA: LysE family translocator [Legionella pneumophila]|nr:LysE family translocator [Legionella pneumophila]